jgi:hypothetical protein
MYSRSRSATDLPFVVMFVIFLRVEALLELLVRELHVRALSLLPHPHPLWLPSNRVHPIGRFIDEMTIGVVLRAAESDAVD